MGVRTTSISAYKSLKLQPRQLEVLRWICLLSGDNARHISNASKIPINCITGRIKELKKLKLIEEGVKKKDMFTGRLAIILYPTILGIKINNKGDINE